MSLILEALKKAERQHKLGEVPGIRAEAIEPQPSPLRGLGWVMLLLFACIMLGLGLYLGGFRMSMPEETAQQTPSSAPASVERPAPVRPTTEAAPLSVAPVPAPIPDEAPPVAAKPIEPPPVKKVAAAPPPGPAKPLNEMPSSFIAHLPSLSIDIHSYDRNPAKRYVLINMEKYHEGDYLAEGPQLIEILPDGAILDYLGERFILPIGNN